MFSVLWGLLKEFTELHILYWAVRGSYADVILLFEEKKNILDFQNKAL